MSRCLRYREVCTSRQGILPGGWCPRSRNFGHMCWPLAGCHMAVSGCASSGGNRTGITRFPNYKRVRNSRANSVPTLTYCRHNVLAAGVMEQCATLAISEAGCHRRTSSPAFSAATWWRQSPSRYSSQISWCCSLAVNRDLVCAFPCSGSTAMSVSVHARTIAFFRAPFVPGGTESSCHGQ